MVEGTEAKGRREEEPSVSADGRGKEVVLGRTAIGRNCPKARKSIGCCRATLTPLVSISLDVSRLAPLRNPPKHTSNRRLWRAPAH